GARAAGRARGSSQSVPALAATHREGGQKVKDWVGLCLCRERCWTTGMAAASRERLHDALKAVLFPGHRRDIVTLGMVADVRIAGGVVEVDLRPGTDKAETLAALRASVDATLRREPGVERVVVHVAGREAGRGRDPFAARG